MKKTLLFAVMAGAALAGCVKNEEVAKSDSSPERITFDAPVVRIPTRATEIVNDYPKDKDFAVYALHTQSPISLPASTADGTQYMTNEKCVADNATTPTCWVPADRNYYWPKNGVLTFGAYAPARTLTTNNEVEWDAVNGFKFNDYLINSTPADQIDLLYCDPVYNKTKANNDTDNPYDGITLMFKHALSSIVFTANTDGTFGNDKISITNITVKNIYQQGDFAQNYKGGNSGNIATWTVEGPLTNYQVFSGDKELKDFNQKDGTKKYTPINGDLDPTEGDGERRSDLIVMPQKLNGGEGGRGNGITDAIVDITYKITYSNMETTTETVTFKLAVKDNNDADGNPQYVWEMGKRYTYHITIGLDKIYFNPKVTDWVDEEGELIR